MMIIEYKTSVCVDAGFRSTYIKAKAKKISEKRCEVLEVLMINDEPTKYNMSLTGSKRQSFNGEYVAKNEIGKTKIISKLFSVTEEQEQ